VPAPPPAPANPLELAAQRGYDVSGYQDPNQFVEDLLAGLQEYERSRPYVELGRQVAGSTEEIETYRRWKEDQDRQRQAPEPPKEPESSWQWDAPEFDPGWRYLFDENGNLRPGADPALPDKVRRYQDWATRKQAEFLQDPRSLITAAVGDELAKRDAEIAALRQQVEHRQQAETRQQAQNELETYFDQHAAQVYQHNEQGQPLADPRTGQPVPQPRAMEAYHGAAEVARVDLQKQDEWSPEEVRAFTRAFDLLLGNGAATPEPAPAAPTQPDSPNFRSTYTTSPAPPMVPSGPPRDSRGRFISPHDHTPERSGAVPDPTAPGPYPAQRHVRMEDITGDLIARQGEPTL